MRTSDGALEYSLRVLRRRKYIILAAVIAVPLFAFLYSSAQTEEYTASATLLFEGDSESTEASRQNATNEALAALPQVAVRAARELGDESSIGEVLGSVEVSSANEMANITTISATNESPERAAEIANAYARAYIAFRRDSDRSQLKESIAVIQDRLDGLPESETGGRQREVLEEQLSTLEVEEALKTGNTSLVQEATPPSSPSSPKTSRNVFIGLIFGLVLGVVLAALVERLDRRIRTVEELEELFGLPLIARIPRSKMFRNATIDTMLATPEGEAFRILRTNLRYLSVNRNLSTLLIASPEPNDGKSTAARGLAGAMAELGDNVVLIEGDLRKESAFARGAGGLSEGLSGVLVGAPLDSALIEVVVSASRTGPSRTLTVLPSGRIPPNPSEMLESERMRELLEELEERFEMVIIDTPATGFVSDAMSLVPRASAVVAVGGVGATTREGAHDFVKQLELIGKRPLGLIATLAPPNRNQYSYERQAQRLSRG